MNHLKNNPVGIDAKIDYLQQNLYPILLDAWGSLDMYGRTYKVQKSQDEISLEVYVSDGEYEKILYSEGNKVFFVQGENPDFSNGFFYNDLWIISIVNVEEIKNVAHRADEEIHLDMFNALNGLFLPKEIDSVQYGMANLRRVVEDVYGYGNFKFTDVHPYHAFMVKTKVKYRLSDIKC